MLTTMVTNYDWNKQTPYSKSEFFELVDKTVKKYFYGFYHPLGKKLLEGFMTPEELKFLAKQEYYYYASTTWWNAFKIAHCDTLEQQRLLHSQLLDELGNDLIDKKAETAHATLFLKYCEGLGLTKQEVVNTPVLPSVMLAVTELMRIAFERPQFEFVACSNLVVERMRPLHYQDLLKTFSTHYTWVPESCLQFYKVHAYLDEEHDSIGRQIVASYLGSKRDQDSIFSSVLRSLCLRLVMYDGIFAALDGSQIGIEVWPNFPKDPWPRPMNGESS